MKIKHTNTPEESDRIVDLLLNGNKTLKSENTDSKEKTKEIVDSLYFDRPIILDNKAKEIMEKATPVRCKLDKYTTPIQVQIEEGKQALKEFKPNLYKEKVVNELNSCSNYEHGNIKNCPICGKQSLSASNHYCRDHTNSDDTDKYRVEYDGVVCTEVNWETKEFCFTFKGKKYKYKQQGDISCNADTDHIRCVIEEFKENLMKKEENNMENYIVINGKKTELTEEQLKQLGIEVEKKRNNPFNSKLECEDKYYYYIRDDGIISKESYIESCDEEDEEYIKKYINIVNSFNDKNFANQVYLHELLNRKLLKYAYDHEAEDCEWDEDKANPHYYIYFDSTKGHFVVEAHHFCHSQNIYFSSEKVAKQAIEDVIKPFMKEHPEFVW